jgi:hypothetical protein
VAVIGVNTIDGGAGLRVGFNLRIQGRGVKH